MFEQSLSNNIHVMKSLLNKYPNLPNINELVQKIERAEAKIYDRRLNLAVVGEFSSGKSTTINDLLNDEIMETHAIGGTTKIPFRIIYGQVLSAEVVSRNKAVFKQVKSEPIFISKLAAKLAELADKLSFRHISNIVNRLVLYAHLSTKKAVSLFIQQTFNKLDYNDIKEVVIYHPAYFLQNDIVIIDTPGSNQKEQHTEIAERVIKEECDSLMITITAESPVPETLVAFLKKYYRGNFEKCIFVVTKLGIVGDSILTTPDELENDRRETLDYIKAKLIAELDIKEPYIVVLPPRSSKEKPTDWYEQNRDAHNRIREHLENNRRSLQQMRMLELQDDLTISLHSSLKNLTLEALEKKNFLQEHKMEDWDIFKQRTFEKHANTFSEKLELGAEQLRKDFEQHVWIKYEYIFNSIKEASTAAKLDYAVNVNSKDVLATMHNCATELLEQFNKTANSLCSQELLIVEKEFSSAYENYAAISYQQRNSNSDREVKFIDTNININVTTIGGLVDTKNLENTIGTIFGTTAVKIVETLLDVFFGPSFDEKKNLCIEEMSQIITKVDEKFTKLVDDAFCKIWNASYAEYNMHIEGYIHRYEAAIIRSHEEEEENICKLEELIEQLSSDEMILKGMSENLKNEFNNRRT